MGMPVHEGSIIAITHAIGIAKLAIEYDKPIEWIVERLEERKAADEQLVKELA